MTGILTSFLTAAARYFLQPHSKLVGSSPIVERIVRGTRYVDCVNAHICDCFCVFHAGFKVVTFAGFADFGIKLVESKANDDGIISALFSDAFDDFAQETKSVFKTSAVLVRSVIGVW